MRKTILVSILMLMLCYEVFTQSSSSCETTTNLMGKFPHTESNIKRRLLMLESELEDQTCKIDEKHMSKEKTYSKATKIKNKPLQDIVDEASEKSNLEHSMMDGSLNRNKETSNKNEHRVGTSNENDNRSETNIEINTEDTYHTLKNITLPRKLNFTQFRRMKLPVFESLKLNEEIPVELPGDIEAKLQVLSLSPLVFQVDNFFDEEESELLIDIAKHMKLKKVTNKIPYMELKTADQTFKEWDYDQDGYVTKEEVSILPGLADMKFSLEDADDMFFMLKMDQNNDGKIELDEMKKTDFTKARKYFNSIKSDISRQRNISARAAWLWHDNDGLLKYNQDGFYEGFHERISMVTEIPVEILKESEPLQLKEFHEGQFQMVRQDSETQNKDTPCCLYGDQNKVCRLCRYISYSIFLNDVEEGGELVLPLAKHKFQDIANNTGIWRGYYVYAKTTGSRFYFQVDMTFTKDGANTIFTGDGKDESGGFTFDNSIIIGETIKFEKRYKDGGETVVKCHGKIIEGTKISGNWWISGEKRMRGTFFMWNREYEIFSGRAIDETNQDDKCSLTKSLKIKPKQGRAIFWYNHHINPRDGMVGDINQESMSAHCEVKKGVKWAVNSWINIIGDGDLELRAWRRGDNWLMFKNVETYNIFQVLGTNDKKLTHEPYENEYIAEQSGRNGTSTDETIPDGYHKYKPASSALQALSLLVNDLDMDQLRILARHVHKKLGMQCIPLTVQHEGKVSVIDGSVA